MNALILLLSLSILAILVHAVPPGGRSHGHHRHHGHSRSTEESSEDSREILERILGRLDRLERKLSNIHIIIHEAGASHPGSHSDEKDSSQSREQPDSRNHEADSRSRYEDSQEDSQDRSSDDSRGRNSYEDNSRGRNSYEDDSRGRNSYEDDSWARSQERHRPGGHGHGSHGHGSHGHGSRGGHGPGSRSRDSHGDDSDEQGSDSYDHSDDIIPHSQEPSDDGITVHVHVKTPSCGNAHDTAEWTPHPDEFFHHMILPGREVLEPHVDFIHSTCSMVPGSRNVTGTVHMKQQFWGEGPVTMRFELHGITPYESFKVHRYGDVSNRCANIGARHVPPENAWWSPGGSADATHFYTDTINSIVQIGDMLFNTSEGLLGSLPCGEDEKRDCNVEQAFDAVTLVGMHSIIGKSLAIHGRGEEVYACCVIGDGSAAYFGDIVRPWVMDEILATRGEK